MIDSEQSTCEGKDEKELKVWNNMFQKKKVKTLIIKLYFKVPFV